MIDWPKSPTSASPTKRPYCSIKGRSKPSCVRIAATVSGVARPCIMIWMGSPGTRWMGKNPTRLTPKMTGTTCRSRFAMQLRNGRACKPAARVAAGAWAGAGCPILLGSRLLVELDVLQPPPAVGQLFPALHIALQAVHRGNEIEWHAVAVVVDRLLHLGVELGPLLVVGGRARFLQHLLHIRVLVPGEERVGAGIEVGLDGRQLVGIVDVAGDVADVGLIVALHRHVERCPDVEL